MPFPAWCAVVALAMLFACFASGVAYALSARLFGTSGWRKVIAPITGLSILGNLAGLMLAIWSYTAYGAGLVVLIALLIVPFVFARVTTLRRWRLVLGFVVGFVLTSIANLAVGVAVRATIAHTIVIASSSMAPTIVPNDRLVFDSSLEPSRWDVIVWEMPGTDSLAIKRLVGMPGESIEICDGRVRVNGVPVTPPRGIPAIAYSTDDVYLGRDGWRSCTGGHGIPTQLGPDEYFILGDNTAQSLDSRYLSAYPDHQPGAIPRERIRGVVRARYSPSSSIAVFR